MSNMTNEEEQRLAKGMEEALRESRDRLVEAALKSRGGQLSNTDVILLDVDLKLEKAEGTYLPEVSTSLWHTPLRDGPTMDVIAFFQATRQEPSSSILVVAVTDSASGEAFCAVQMLDLNTGTLDASGKLTDEAWITVGSRWRTRKGGYVYEVTQVDGDEIGLSWLSGKDKRTVSRENLLARYHRLDPGEEIPPIILPEVGSRWATVKGDVYEVIDVDDQRGTAMISWLGGTYKRKVSFEVLMKNYKRV